MEESVLFTFPYQTNRNDNVFSEWHWKSTLDFTGIVNNYGVKQGTLWQIARFISQFYLKLYVYF